MQYPSPVGAVNGNASTVVLHSGRNTAPIRIADGGNRGTVSRSMYSTSLGSAHPPSAGAAVGGAGGAGGVVTAGGVGGAGGMGAAGDAVAVGVGTTVGVTGAVVGASVCRTVAAVAGAAVVVAVVPPHAVSSKAPDTRASARLMR